MKTKVHNLEGEHIAVCDGKGNWTNPMKLIQPCPHTPAQRVKNWREIKEDALELREFIKQEFKGHYNSAFAISHAQVSEDPKSFFVVNEDVSTEVAKVKNQGNLTKTFGSWCIVNAEILLTKKPVPIEVPFKDACMGFPFRKPKEVQRIYRIKVKYYIPFFGFLRKKVEVLEGVPSFIVQHELEHAEGKNIYGI